jgi:hypothetical protein
MAILHIQQTVTDYDEWKRAFDGDPVHMQDGGVRRYRIQRDVSDPHFVMVDLEFDTVERAEGFLQRLRHLWSGTNLNGMHNLPAWVVETVESVEVEPVLP